MTEAWKRQKDAQTPAQGLLFRQELCGGDPSKRARAHWHTQAWADTEASGRVTGRSLRDTIPGQ
jgi:hypothetical protein